MISGLVNEVMRVRVYYCDTNPAPNTGRPSLDPFLYLSTLEITIVTTSIVSP